MKPLSVIIILGILIGAGFYYRDTLAQKIADLYPSQTIPPTPKIAETTPTPSPTAVPTPVVTPTPALSIAQIPNGQPLPKSGPEEDLLLAGGVGLLSGIGVFVSARPKKRNRSIDIR